MGGSQFTKTLCTGFSQTQEMTMGAAPILISGVCENPVHRVMVNWYPLIPAGWEAGPNHHGHYGTRFAVFSCTQQPKNLHLKPVYFLQYLSIQDISLQSQSQ